MTSKRELNEEFDDCIWIQNPVKVHQSHCLNLDFVLRSAQAHEREKLQ